MISNFTEVESRSGPSSAECHVLSYWNPNKPVKGPIQAASDIQGIAERTTWQLQKELQGGQVDPPLKGCLQYFPVDKGLPV